MWPLNPYVLLAVAAPIYGAKLAAYGWGTDSVPLMVFGTLISLLGLPGLVELVRFLRPETPKAWRVGIVVLYLYLQAALVLLGAGFVLENLWAPIFTNLARGAFFSGIPLAVVLGIGIWDYYNKDPNAGRIDTSRKLHHR